MGIDKNTVSGKIKEVKGQVREQWGKMTNDPKQVIKGNAEQAIGKTQQAVGDLKEKTKTAINEGIDRVKNPDKFERPQPAVVDPMAINKKP